MTDQTLVVTTLPLPFITVALEKPDDYLRFKKRESIVLNQLKTNRNVLPESLESYIESEKVTKGVLLL